MTSGLTQNQSLILSKIQEAGQEGISPRSLAEQYQKDLTSGQTVEGVCVELYKANLVFLNTSTKWQARKFPTR